MIETKNNTKCKKTIDCDILLCNVAQMKVNTGVSFEESLLGRARSKAASTHRSLSGYINHLISLDLARDESLDSLIERGAIRENERGGWSVCVDDGLAGNYATAADAAQVFKQNGGA